MRGVVNRALESSESAVEARPAVHGAVVGALLGVDRDGTVRVSVPGHGEARARLLSGVSRAEVLRSAAGREVVVLCEGGDPARPLVVGLLEDPAEALLAFVADDGLEAAGPARDRVFSAEGSITLLCGEASLTLHADGRVVTRGVNVVSVASEQQRIQGAVVRIN